MKNLFLSLALAFGLTLTGSAATPTPTITPNATQTPHVVNFDSAEGGTITAATSTWTMSHTIGGGNDRALLVNVLMPTDHTTDYVSGVSVGGLSMTKIISTRIRGNTYTANLTTFYLNGVTPGAQTITVTLSVTESGYGFVTAASYNNVAGVVNINGKAAPYQASLSGGFPVGITGSMLTGVFYQHNSVSINAGVNSAPMTNRVLVDKVLGWMSVDDLRVYSPGSTTITWNGWTATNDPEMMNYVELVAR